MFDQSAGWRAALRLSSSPSRLRSRCWAARESFDVLSLDIAVLKVMR